MNVISFKNDATLRVCVFFLFVVLLIGSIYYYQERMLFCDASHIFFDIANNHSLQLSFVARYGAFITQIFPLAATYFHVPIKVALLLYSMSFNLFFLVVAAILLFKYKNTKLAILFALYLTLFVTQTYFWTNNEIHQAVGWLFLLFGIVQNYKYQKKNQALHFTIVVILAGLSVFTHPLILFVFPFLWLFTIIEKDLNPYSKKQIIVLSVLFVAIFVLKYWSMNQNSYDSNKVHGFTHFSFLDLWNAFSSFMAKTMADKLVKDYFFVPILFVLGLIAAIVKKKYKAIALVFLFTVSYFLAICLTYGDFLTFYIESEWMPFSIITSTLFVYYFAPSINTKWLTVSLLVIFAVRINLIQVAASRFVARKQWIFARVNDMKQQGIYKGYIYLNDPLQSMLLINWGVPTESLLASTIMGENPNRTFIVDSKDVIDQRMSKSKDTILGNFQNFSYQIENHYYFSFDTTQTYRLINFKQND
jgi:hypothetical protein